VLNMALVLVLHNSIIIIVIIIIGLMSCCMQLFRAGNGLVGIATCYVLDGPGIETRWGKFFSQPSKPSLRSTQLPLQWIWGNFRA
jgi:hypothetical protein